MEESDTPIEHVVISSEIFLGRKTLILGTNCEKVSRFAQLIYDKLKKKKDVKILKTVRYNNTSNFSNGIIVLKLTYPLKDSDRMKNFLREKRTVIAFLPIEGENFYEREETSGLFEIFDIIMDIDSIHIDIT